MDDSDLGWTAANPLGSDNHKGAARLWMYSEGFGSTVDAPQPPFSKRTWSIKIDPAGDRHPVPVA